MRFKECKVVNFGSYANLEIDFSSLGLSLVYGPTGAGKSTIADLACWILYGVTAKDGSVDDVRSWTNPGEPTAGSLQVELSTGNLTVSRVRGKPSQNDLYWTEEAAPDKLIRGKDLNETQNLLEKRLGVTTEAYLTGAYFHEFSPTGAFFTAKSKDRRAVFERLARLDLPVRLAVACSEQKKAAKDSLTSAQSEADKATGRLEQLGRSKKMAETSATAWDATQAATIVELGQKAKGFEKEKEAKLAAIQKKIAAFESEGSGKIDKLISELELLERTLQPPEEFDAQIAAIQSLSRCKACNALTDKSSDKLAAVREEKMRNAQRIREFESGRHTLACLTDAVNPYTEQYDQAADAPNHYYSQVEAERKKANPFLAQVQKMDTEIAQLKGSVELLMKRVGEIQRRYTALNALYDLSFELRGELLRKAVKEIEASTNRCLETHFDAELRVSFSLEGADNLEVEIQKSGYLCVYRQLSKGQRQLLKLAFVVSVMKAAANNAGAHFSDLFFDEALDGLDSDLKVKAFSLFQELEQDHETVLLIDHAPEFQNLFERRFKVTLAGDTSEVTLERSE